MVRFFIDRGEKTIVGNGKITAVTSIFSFLPQCFRKALVDVVKTRDYFVKSKFYDTKVNKMGVFSPGKMIDLVHESHREHGSFTSKRPLLRWNSLSIPC